MISATPSWFSLIFRLGRKFPVPIRRIVLKLYLFSHHGLSKIRENQSLSDYPSILNSSKKSLGESVQFNVYTLAERFQLSIESVCHVGAHKGQEISDYLKLRINAAVLIEPVGENYAVLENAVRSIPNYKAVNMAVGNYEGLVKMNLASNDFQSSSVLQPHLHLQEAPNIIFNNVIECEISTLDRILSDSKVWDLIVIDVQGYELQVLQGAIRTLENCNYIFIEVNRAETYKGCTQIKDLDKFLFSHGFQRVLTKWWSSWGDAFYVRMTLLPLDLVTK